MVLQNNGDKLYSRESARRKMKSFFGSFHDAAKLLCSLAGVSKEKRTLNMIFFFLSLLLYVWY